MLLRLTSQGERWQQLGREVLGGKAIGIQRLQAVGLPVPETWVIPAGEAAQEHELRGLVRFASRWAVRSSAALEDDARHSFAGIFTTELDVPATDLGAAIARVRSSAGSRRAISACASSHVMRIHLPSPRLPTRFKGNSRRSG